MTAAAHPTVTRDVVFPISAPPVCCDRAARVPQASASACGTLSIGSNAGRPTYERPAGRRRRIPPTPPIRHIPIVQGSVAPNAARRLRGDDRARSVVGETAAARNSAEFIDRIRQAAANRLLSLSKRVGRGPSHKQTTMSCIHCRGKMSRSTAPFHVDRAGYHLSFHTIPAWVCNQCGEAYFEEREVSAIQTAVDSLDRQTRQLSAPA